MPLKKALNILPRIPSPLPAGECLGVELIEDELRATLVRTKGRRQEILDFAAMKVPEGGDELPDINQLREITRRLNCKPKTRAVLATSMARVVVLPMNRERVGRMKRHLLAEAVKWEAETYTGIAANQALAGVEVEESVREPGQVAEEMEEVFVHVSVLERNIFRAVRERFRMAGLRLARIYSSDVCFHVPLLAMHPDSDRGVLEIGRVASGFALLKGGQTLSINTMNITTQMIHEHLSGQSVPDLESTLHFNLRQAPAPLPVAVTGSGALDERVLDFLNSLSPNSVEPVALRRRAGLIAAGAEESPVFATAAGAAMRELGRRALQDIGITDAVPLLLRIRQSFYLVPVATAALLFLLLFGHNLLMRYQEESFRQQRRDIQAQMDERRDELERARSLEREINETEAQIDEVSRQINVLSQDLDRDIRTLGRVLQALVSEIPGELSLQQIRQDPGSPEVFEITGNAVSVTGVMEYVLNLRESRITRSVEVQRLERGGGARGLSHRFLIRMEARQDGPESDPA